MKNFTRLLFIMSLAFGYTSSYAQLDLAITDLQVSCTPDNTVPDSLRSSIYCTFANDGDEIMPTDSITLGLAINNDTVYGPYNLSGNFANGATLNMPHSFTLNGNAITFYYTFTGAPGTSFDVCAYALFTSSAEPNITNNIACKTITISDTINNDWSTAIATIGGPSELDGFDVWDKPNEEYLDVPSIDSVMTRFTNNGPVSYTERTGLFFRVEVGSSSQSFVAVLGQDIIPGASEQVPVTNTTALANLVMPTDSGNYKMCAIVDMVSDNNSGNNKLCDGFRINNSFKPKEPVGITDLNGSDLVIYSAANEIKVSGVVEPENIRVMDMQGRVVSSTTLSADGSVPMTASTAGIYMVQSTNTVSGVNTVTRVSIQ